MPSPLSLVFARIDRRIGCNGYRRLLRAAAALNHDDPEAFRVEMEAGLVEAADEMGLSRAEVTEMIQQAVDVLRRMRRHRN